MKSSLGISIVAACGTCFSIAAVVNAQPRVVNISGATLLENYVRAPASTNDYLDLDGDGIAGRFNSPTIDQLAPSLSGGSFTPNHHFVVQYRVVGSVNGFIELMKFGCGTPATGDDTNVNGILGNRPPAVTGGATTAYANRAAYINLGASTGVYNQGNPGGAPYTSDSLYLALYAAPPSSSGGSISIDVAPLDVPTRWAVQTAGTALFNATPGQPGYGAYPRRSTNRDGTTTGFGNLSNELPPLLNGRNLFEPTNPGAANTNTIFDNPLSWAVICPVVNPGTGISQLTVTQMQYLFVTGRAQNGENLHAITRDVGSGTRNAWSNCLGVDPSWTVGDNVGGLSTQAVNNNIGVDYTPTNKGANSGVEATLRNARLGIGYIGGERGVTGSGSGSWLTGSNPALQIPDVKNDIYGGTAWVRPTADAIVHNNVNGWVIGGPAILATIGDPNAEPVGLGGLGTANPRMCNIHAAAYVNNISRSIENFFSVPGDPANVGMPGEYAATQFTLTGALDNVHNFVTPTQMDVNPAFNASLQAYTLANSIYSNGLFASYHASARGKVPVRNAGPTYTDGVVGGNNYINQAGASVSYASDLTLRNLIAGDFNGDGLRNLNDVSNMVAAWRQRNGGPTWTAPSGTGAIAGAPGTDAIIEVLGDFDGNGSFNSADLRYFADGLAVKTSTGNIDRREGFASIDLAFNGNFFGTTLATAKPYVAGDSRGDVAGAPGINRGWAPVGANGVVNAADIDYVYRQFKQNAYVLDGAANWNVIAEAVSFDLSADMTGDLIVDQADVVELVTVVLGTTMTDVNLDGLCNQADLDVATSFLGQTGGWAKGDLNGDGTITQADLDLISSCLCSGTACGDQDFNGDGDFGTDQDIEAFFACLGGNCCTTCFCQGSDFNGDGDFGTDSDIEAFFRVLGGGNC
jgi:hypothetical protein